LWAMQNGYMDPVPPDRIKEFQVKLQDYLGTRHEKLLAAIRDKKALDETLEGQLKAVLDEFKQIWQ
jgi:F-type H+-transporting ATPase subunit alpha